MYRGIDKPKIVLQERLKCHIWRKFLHKEIDLFPSLKPVEQQNSLKEKK